MSDGFNPYREWLGLGTNSPSYYDLLGLPLQESDTATIAAAAERAITKVRGFRPGPLAREWAGLLDEIRAAKECLLNANSRTQYDAEQARAAAVDPILPPEAATEAEATAPAYAPAVKASSDLDPPSPNHSAIGATPIYAPTPQLPEALVIPKAMPAATQTWSAGPSTIYGIASDENSAVEALPAAIAIPNLLPATPTPTAIPEHPILPATTKTLQRAIFRVAPVTPQKPARPRGRGVTWGAIVLLWLFTAGLTYRLNVVARQQKLNEAAAAATAAKRGATEKPGDRSPRLQAEITTAAPAAPQFEPTSPEHSQHSATETPVRHDFASNAKVTRTQIEQLIESLQAAKAAIVLHDFREADSQLAKATALAQLPSHRDAVSRLRQVNAYVKQFRQALAAAVTEMQVAETFEVGSTHFIFVEGQPDAMILRTAAKNETYRFNDMPPDLAIVLADRKLAAHDPLGRVVKGAYLLVNKRTDSQTRAQAEKLWTAAHSHGASITHLLPFLNDDYPVLLADATE